MKVLPVSFSFKSKKNYEDINLNYLYSYSSSMERNKLFNTKYITSVGLIASFAVIGTLINLGGRKKFPPNIVEIANPNKGLNKILNNDKAVESIKTKIIYPIRASILGDKSKKNMKNFKTGLVLTGKDAIKLNEINHSVIEHFNELGVESIDIPRTITRKKTEITHTKILKRYQILKQVFNEFKKAKNKYNETGQYTIINLGRLDSIMDLQIVKSQKSNLEILLEGLDDKNFSGIIWTGWTTNYKSLPLFFSELPISITKIVD